MTVDFGFKNLAQERHAVQVLIHKHVKCTDDSVLGRVLARVLDSPSPMQKYLNVKAFLDVLEEAEYQLLTQVPLGVDAGGDIHKELCKKELLPLKEFIDEKNTKTICIRYDGTVVAESRTGEISELPFVVTADVFDLFMRSCGYGVEGKQVRPLELPEFNCKMVFASNGWKGNYGSCILLKK